MKILVYALLGLIIGIPTALASTPAREAKKKTSVASTPPSPLSRATQEFKALTLKWGMRPNSPASAKRHFGPKLHYHGRIFEYFRNDALDAIPHEVKQNGGTKSPLHRNQFGFNVSGPLVIPHLLTNPHNTFFTLSYEGVRETISRANLLTVPTVAQRNGDFSKTVNQSGTPLIIYDPSTTSPNPAYNPNQPVSTSNLQYLRSPFPGNIIPADRLAPDVQQALKLYPFPNAHVGPFFQNNYFINSPQKDDADGIIARVDESIGNKQRLSFSTAVSYGYLSTAQYFPDIASPTAPPQHYARWRAAIDYVYTATAKTVNSFHVEADSNVVQAGNSGQTPFPVYQLDGNYVSMGTGFPESHNAHNTVEVRDTISTHQGKHSLHLSFQADQHQVNSFTPQYPSGYFEFSSGLTSLPGINNTGDPFATFLLGLAQGAQRTIVTEPSYFRDSYQSVSGGDDYRVSKEVTLNLDLSLTRHTPRVEKNNRQSTVDPAVYDPQSLRMGGLAFAGRHGIPRGLRLPNINFNWYLGVAWNPGVKSQTQVRASYHHWYGHIPIYNGQFDTQGFNATQTFTSSNTELSPALNIEDGVPPLSTPLPDISPSAADNTVADYTDLSNKVPTYRSAQVSVERQIPFSLMVTVGTKYMAGKNILVGNGATNPEAVNPADLKYGNELYNQPFHLSLQPYPQFTTFNLYGLYPAGRFQRNQGYVRVQKRESFGLSFTATYEVSREYDDYSGPYGNQNLVDIRSNWAPTSWNNPQFLYLSYMYKLPFGPGKPLLDFSGWGRPLVSGWSVSGTAYWNDGRPLAMIPEFNNTGNVINTLYVNTVPGVSPHVANPSPSEWFNPAAFAQPADFTVGNAQRTIPGLLGPGYNSMDVSLDKRMPVGDTSLDFNVEAFNVLNHGNWNYPNTTIGPPSAPNVEAGKIIGSYGGRIIQLGLIVSF